MELGHTPRIHVLIGKGEKKLEKYGLYQTGKI